MTAGLAWNCDVCGKPGLTLSAAGILYCKYCNKSYGEKLFKPEMKEKLTQIIEEAQDGVVDAKGD